MFRTRQRFQINKLELSQAETCIISCCAWSWNCCYCSTCHMSWGPGGARRIFCVVLYCDPTIIETVRLNRLHWFGHVLRMEEIRIPKRVLCMNLITKTLRGRPRNRWQDEVREDGRIVGGGGWQEKVHSRVEWKKLLRTARNRRILHMPMERVYRDDGGVLSSVQSVDLSKQQP